MYDYRLGGPNRTKYHPYLELCFRDNQKTKKMPRETKTQTRGRTSQLGYGGSLQP